MHERTKDKPPSGSFPELSSAVELRPIDLEVAEQKGAAGAPDRLGRYVVCHPLGEGGMGRVVAADDPHLKRRLAIKQLHEKLHSAREHLQRFIEEAQVTAQLEHPNIVPVYDMGINERGHLFFAMRRVSGQSLSEIADSLAAGDPIAVERYTLPRLLGIFQKVCMAVAYAHSRGVIHRDLKPPNVMVGEHGEVYLMDWGLCKVLGADAEREAPDRSSAQLARDIERARRVSEVFTHPEGRVSSLRATSDALKTAVGIVHGTPAYMAPEEVRGKGEEGSVKGDIYALGAILYEILTLLPPVDGTTLRELMRRAAAGKIVPPKVRAPERQIPEELERICMKALSRSPEDRQVSARELHDEVEQFLEGTAEQERRRKAARAAVEAGRKLSADYERVLHELKDAELGLYLARLGTRSDASGSAYEKVHVSTQRHDDLRDETVRSFGRAVRRYEEALSHEVDNREARAALARLYWSRFVQAEQRGDPVDMLYFRERIEAYNDGLFDGALKGEGSLKVSTEPVRARVAVRRFDDHGGVSMLGAEHDLGEAPAEVLPIPMGSYVVTLRAPGYRPARVHISVTRQGHPKLRVRLRASGEVADGFVFVPGGPFVMGGDPQNPGAGPYRVEVVKDFAVAAFPVTAAQYLEFLNDVAGRSPERARSHVPRRRVDGDLLWHPGEDGRYALPTRDLDGARWHPNWPINHVSWIDATAFCAWLAERTGRPMRLPTSAEWEKAGRGVDGRSYPWGKRFDPSFCKMGESRPEHSVPEPVGTFPMDESPYGVRDMAGSVGEWCGGWFDEGRGQRPLRGVGFDASEFECRLTYVRGHRPYQVPYYAGFRVAHGFED